MNNKAVITIAGFKLWDKAAISMDKTTVFFAEFAWKKEFSFQRRETLFILSTNMAAVTSTEKQQ